VSATNASCVSATARTRNSDLVTIGTNGNVPPAPVPREHVEGSYDAMVKLHGRPIGRFEEGTKYARMAGRQVDLTKSPWKPLTDTQLRDHYKRPEVA
jgi:hypothetical protein